MKTRGWKMENGSGKTFWSAPAERGADGAFEAGRAIEHLIRLEAEKRFPGHRTPKAVASLSALALLLPSLLSLVSPSLHAATRTSANYSLTAETMDGGGGTFSSASYISATSIEPASIGTGSSANYDVQHGYIAAEVVAVAVLVEGQWVFYNHSQWDGNNAAADANDDNAIAPDKSALLPGGVATFANYTSYSRGLNGLMVDIAGLAGTPTASDFTFKTGNDQTPAGWALAPDPFSVTVRVGAGADGSDRVTLIWNDNNLDATADPNEAVAKAWLEVTVRATANTGLAADHTFYFGNAVGEVGNSAIDTLVDTTDVLQPFYHQTSGGAAGLTSPFDINRDRTVDTTDVLLPFYHQTGASTALVLLDLSGGGGGGSSVSLATARPLSGVGLQSLMQNGWVEGFDRETGLPLTETTTLPALRLLRADAVHLFVQLESAAEDDWRLQWTDDLGQPQWRTLEAGPTDGLEGQGWWLELPANPGARFFRVVKPSNSQH
ncbi:MAG: hypothetical protein H7A46_06935 [Verrucomicrobiales bacterium]|nr:hypothetical protein [Verrucomicrobiales bacterium]